jgi:DNA invertase Pin-like site-specific DNA recombinase
MVFRMDIGYMRVSSENERQTTDLQKDALLKANKEGHLYIVQSKNNEKPYNQNPTLELN